MMMTETLNVGLRIKLPKKEEKEMDIHAWWKFRIFNSIKLRILNLHGEWNWFLWWSMTNDIDSNSTREVTRPIQ
jgi:hypothetical protein